MHFFSFSLIFFTFQHLFHTPTVSAEALEQTLLKTFEWMVDSTDLSDPGLMTCSDLKMFDETLNVSGLVPPSFIWPYQPGSVLAHIGARTDYGNLSCSAHDDIVFHKALDSACHQGGVRVLSGVIPPSCNSSNVPPEPVLSKSVLNFTLTLNTMGLVSGDTVLITVSGGNGTYNLTMTVLPGGTDTVSTQDLSSYQTPASSVLAARSSYSAAPTPCPATSSSSGFLLSENGTSTRTPISGALQTQFTRTSGSNSQPTQGSILRITADTTPTSSSTFASLPTSTHSAASLSQDSTRSSSIVIGAVVGTVAALVLTRVVFTVFKVRRQRLAVLHDIESSFDVLETRGVPTLRAVPSHDPPPYERRPTITF